MATHTTCEFSEFRDKMGVVPSLTCSPEGEAFHVAIAGTFEPPCPGTAREAPMLMGEPSHGG